MNIRRRAWIVGCCASALLTGSCTQLISLTGSHGVVQWEYTTAGHYIPSSPAIAADGTMYIAVELSDVNSNALRALTPDGTQKWSVPLAGLLEGSPAIGPDGTVYIGLESNGTPLDLSTDPSMPAGGLFAFTPDGQLKWRATGITEIASTPALGADGTIYVGANDGHLYALAPDGTQNWAFQTQGSPYHCSPVVGRDGTIYVGTVGVDANLYAIHPDGTQKWVATASGDTMIIECTAGIGEDGTVYVTVYRSAPGDPSQNRLIAINPDGTIKWEHSINGMETWSSPVVGPDGTVYVQSDEGLVAASPGGARKWLFPMRNNATYTAAVAGDGVVYVGSFDDHLWAVNANGSVRWSVAVPLGSTCRPTIGPDGTVYVATALYEQNAVKLLAIGGSAGPSQVGWPMYMHDVRHSGRVGGP